MLPMDMMMMMMMMIMHPLCAYGHHPRARQAVGGCSMLPVDDRLDLV
jgi:hypothetical protein